MKSTGNKKRPLRARLHRWRRNIHGIPHEKLIFSSAGILLTGAVAISVCTAGGVFSEKTGAAGNNSTEVRAEASAEQTAETVSLSEPAHTEAAEETAAAENTENTAADETAENTAEAENTADTADSVSFFSGLKTKVEANSFFKSLTGEENSDEENPVVSAESENTGETGTSASSQAQEDDSGQAASSEAQEASSQTASSEAQEDSGQAASAQTQGENSKAASSEAQEDDSSKAASSQAQDNGSQSESSQETAKTDKSVQSSSDPAEAEETGAGKTEDGKLDFRTRSYLRVELEVENVKQNPELPTGCESVAATIALKSIGYTDLEKCTIADEYLAKGTNYAVSYVGNPHTSSGAGCFPPAIVSAVNKYLREQGSSLRASDLTGTDLNDLLALVDSGYPVIIWNTQGNVSARTGGASVTYNGTVYQWYYPEHCMVLYGYDREKDAVLISDPIDGKVERSYQQFKKNYDATGQYAVVIQ